MKTERIMTRNVLTCSPHDSLETAARRMWESDVGCLVVTDTEQRPVGMVTDRDLAMAAYTRGASLRDILVQDTISRHVVTCGPSTPLSELEWQMRSAQVRRIPVVDLAGMLIGIVTLGDVARSAHSGPMHFGEMPGVVRTLARITEPRLREPVATQLNEAAARARAGMRDAVASSR